MMEENKDNQTEMDKEKAAVETPAKETMVSREESSTGPEEKAVANDSQVKSHSEVSEKDATGESQSSDSGAKDSEKSGSTSSGESTDRGSSWNHSNNRPNRTGEYKPRPRFSGGFNNSYAGNRGNDKRNFQMGKRRFQFKKRECHFTKKQN